MAGIWVLAPIIIIFLVITSIYVLIKVIQYTIDSIRNMRKPSSSNIYIHGFLKGVFEPLHIGVPALIIVLFVGSLVLLGVIIRSFITDFGQNWRVVIATSVFINFLVFFFLILSIKTTAAGKSIIRYFGMFITSIFLLTHTVIFSKAIFENIPAHLGGGGTKKVQLLMKLEPSEKAFLQSVGLDFFDEYNQTKTVQLLFATDNEYVFLVGENPEYKPRTISIKKDIVQSIIYGGLRDKDK